jgi:hypothetical protein
VCAPVAAEDRQSADGGFELIKGNIHGLILWALIKLLWAS